MPIVTLSKSMSSAALGAWWGLDNAVGDIACGPRCTGAIACGPRCTGATCRCAAGDADRWGRELIFFWELPVRGCVPAIICRDGCTPYQSCDGCRRRCVFRSMRARQPQLTGRRILEVAPYGYNLYSNPHESTAFPH